MLANDSEIEDLKEGKSLLLRTAQIHDACIVAPSFVEQCIKEGRLLDAEPFRLVVAKPRARITGFHKHHHNLQQLNKMTKSKHHHPAANSMTFSFDELVGMFGLLISRYGHAI